MIESLHIENIAVIKTLDVEFGQGMTVLSGETGAGKSIIIDSLGLLAGGRTEKELIRSGESRAEVSAVFTDLSKQTTELLSELGFFCEDGTLMLSRVVTPTGSSARLNGRGVTLSVLREVAGTLFSIHGQNDNQQLLNAANHLAVLDAYVGHGDTLEKYREEYRRLLHLRAEADSLRRDEQESARMSEILSFQIADIDRVKPKRGEEEALTEMVKRLRSLEQITKCCALVEKALEGGEKSRGAVYLTDRAAEAMDRISDALPEAEKLAARLRDVRYELEDIAASAADLNDTDPADAMAKLDRAEERLDAIAKLKRKYGSDVEEILQFRKDAAERLERMETATDRIIELEDEIKTAENKAKALAADLTDRRRHAAKGLTAAVTETLSYLDMPKVRFEVSIEPMKDFSPQGRDLVEFLLSANAGEPLMPLSKIASGGELARIMLSLKHVLNTCDGIATVIFDEIDTGISGKTSRKVGIKLKEIGEGSQVLCVTHSAQIASLADHHLYISKTEQDGRTQTVLAELDESRRVEEISRILGGIRITEAQRKAAEEMLADRKNYERRT